MLKSWINQFKYKNTCGLCEITQDKERIDKIQAKKSFVIHEEVIDIFHDKLYIFIIEKISFYLRAAGEGIGRGRGRRKDGPTEVRTHWGRQGRSPL